MTEKTGVLILGGGLAGLSTAYHLERLGRGKLSCLVVEKEARPGGLAGSRTQDGFTFDHTGHLLHLHDPYGKELILDLLKGNLALHQRSAWIHSHGVYTRYPFQANTYGLPWRVVEDCVVGLLKTVHGRAAVPKPFPGERVPLLPFKEWSLGIFGAGISKHFMFPYNAKLWQVPLARLNHLNAEEQSRFTPKPAPDEVLYGALTDQRKGFGYNAHFRYPIRGGMQALPDALAARVGDRVLLGRRVLRVHLRDKVAEIEGLGEIRYERLVNTLPLPAFLDIAEPLPEGVRRARRLLLWNSVYNLNLGVARPNVSDKHWIYFPEPRYPFYRVGFSSNFSMDLAPRGASALYVEVSRRPERRVDLEGLERRVLGGLRSCGILRSSDRLLTRQWIVIPCAYVLCDFAHAGAKETIFRFLRRKDIGAYSIGRYGGWKYSFMEETILDGKRCAERLLGLSRNLRLVREREGDKQGQQELRTLR